jgi:hypothetical protein
VGVILQTTRKLFYMILFENNIFAIILPGLAYVVVLRKSPPCNCEGHNAKYKHGLKRCNSTSIVQYISLEMSMRIHPYAHH